MLFRLVLKSKNFATKISPNKSKRISMKRKSREKSLVKIGELARLFSVLPSTINYYTREGLLPEDGRSQGGYRLYKAEKALKILERIDYLQNKKRFTIEEIKRKL